VAGGRFRDINHAIEALRPGTARTYAPDANATRTYDEVYPIYRGLYETLGRSQVELLHGLKRVRRAA
jgi:ribulose kinase